MNKKMPHMDIHQFREFINTFHTDFVIHHYSNVDGKNYWSCLCSAMDWLTEANDALPEVQKRAKSKKAGWIDLYGYISCIDVILEATEQLHRCVFGIGGKPTGLSFPSNCFVTKPEEFSGLSDQAYFKELRAGFGAHPVNLNTHNKKAKRFASWILSSERGQMRSNFDFSVRLYSSLRGVQDGFLGVKLSELDCFCNQYCVHLESIVTEIKRQYGVFVNECRDRLIARNNDPAEQWNILMLEADRRCLGNWEAAALDILSVEPKNSKNSKLLAAYQKALRTLIDRMSDAFQRMDDKCIQKVCENFHQIVYPPYPQENGVSYLLEKMLSSDTNYSVLGKGIETFFAKQINFNAISNNVERQVLIRAALYMLSKKERTRGRVWT